MKVMILSAGLGTRLMPLTEHKPKPLVKVGKLSLLERNIIHLHKYGIREMVINGSKFGEQIDSAISEIDIPGLEISFIDEGLQPMGTAGAIFNAQDNGYFLEENFWVVNSDVLSSYNFPIIQFKENTLGHLILVPNPDHNTNGDFGLQASRVTSGVGQRFTFSGISFLSPRIFLEASERHSSLAVIFREHIHLNNFSGELFSGDWLDVGTVERLNKAEEQICKASNE